MHADSIRDPDLFAATGVSIVDPFVYLETDGQRVILTSTLEADAAGKTSNEEGAAAVRAETCEQCRAYRKILYQEKDTGVEPVADDVASVALDLLLGEEGYHRASGNPLLWLPNTI